MPLCTLFKRSSGGNYKHMISKQALEEFKEIWRKENPGKDIDDKTAMDQAVALLTLMNTVYKPIKKEWLKESVKNDEKKIK